MSNVGSKHYTCRQNITQTKTNKQLYILYVYSPLGQTFWISYREKVEHLQNSSEYCMSIGVKYSLIVLKRFHAKSLV